MLPLKPLGSTLFLPAAVQDDMLLFAVDGKKIFQDNARERWAQYLKVLNPFDRDGIPIQSMRYWGCVEIDGIWDTGCTTTSVDASVAKMLNLQMR